MCHSLPPGTRLRKRENCDEMDFQGAGAPLYPQQWSMACVSPAAAQPQEMSPHPHLGRRRCVTRCWLVADPTEEPKVPLPQSLCSTRGARGVGSVAALSRGHQVPPLLVHSVLLYLPASNDAESLLRTFLLEGLSRKQQCNLSCSSTVLMSNG